MSSIRELGVMLDCSRNGVLQVESVKRMAKLLAQMGYTMMQLYTEDTYEIEGEPYFGHQRGRYTQAELREMDAYCASVGIELVPCIQVLAHLNQIARWEAYRPYMDCFDILLADDPRTERLIEKMFATLATCFTSRRVNVGMDEAHFVGLGKYLQQHGYRDRNEILRGHLEKVCRIARKYGFTIMMWSDMFFRLNNNGEYYPEHSVVPQETASRVPENVRLIYWDYYHTDAACYDRMLTAHEQFGRETVFAGGIWTWTGFAPNLAYSLEIARAALSSAKAHGVTTVFFTLWGDNGKECSFFSALPCLMANAEFARGNFDMDDIARKFRALTGYGFDEFMQLELPNRALLPAIVCGNPSKYLLYNDPFLGLYDSYVPDGAAERCAQAARTLEAAVDGRPYAQLFDMLAKLMWVMEIKADLGVRTRAAYAAGDKEELARLAREDYARLDERLEAFIQAACAVWERENKPFGFEVQDYRLGGLQRRIRHCRTRLLAYACGETARIEELEQPVLPACSTPPAELVCYDWKDVATSSVM